MVPVLKPRRIAMLGGTFDPIHKAHLEMARAAADAFQLDRVLLVPAGNPPHKVDPNRTPYEHRFRMVEIACQHDPLLEASRLEEGNEKSYTWQTLQKLRAAFDPRDRLFLILGADAFAEIATWYRWREVVDTTEFIVVSRPGYTYGTPDGARVNRLEHFAMPESSSEMRRKLFAGWKPDGLPDAVWAYIQAHRLYSS